MPIVASLLSQVLDRYSKRSRGLILAFGLMAFAWSAGSAERSTPPEHITVPPGFDVELLYSVPRAEQGSWVNMTVDPVGRLIVSDQGGKLYRVTPPRIGVGVAVGRGEIKVEPIDLNIGQAHGLLCANGALYVVVNGNAAQGSGLYQVTDLDGDDQYDHVELMRKIEGGGEHGPHAVVLAPDGQSLYVAGGNHTKIPDPELSRVPRNWGEDLLLPRQWDANGHARGILAPGGWVCKTDFEGETWELISIGYRNQFDIAFNAFGDLFTYDADMEWDIGAPWYRPTRICHVASGSDFGWRSGTGKWPEYYADSLPAVVNVGPGSPTGIVFGYGADFPERYQHALYACDWSFGKLYAVHMTPDGASYTGTIETFATAAPLALTDVVVNPRDGALYFTVGGRGTQSGLYRITYSGATAPATLAGVPENRPWSARRMLETFHRRDADAVEVAWTWLGDGDRFVRHAARIALEHQPVEEWRDRALDEDQTDAVITAMIALARQGEKELLGPLLRRLDRLDTSRMNTRQTLGALRALALAFIRMGPPDEDAAREVIRKWNRLFPSESDVVNRELAPLMIYLEAPDAVSRTLRLMQSAGSQQEQIHYAKVLRTAKTGWEMDERRAYFEWFHRASGYKGGASFAGFIRNIKSDAVATLNDDEKRALADVLTDRAADAPAFIIDPNRKFEKEYTTREIVDLAGDSLSGRDFENGRRMFSVAACYSCHYFAGEGGSVGPDLTGAGARFGIRDLVEAIVEPDKVISDQYGATEFRLEDGSVVVGRVANLAGETLMIVTDMFAPGDFTNVKRSQIKSIAPSPVSQMPAGLINILTPDEILDLLAYLRSGGDPGHSAFK